MTKRLNLRATTAILGPLVTAIVVTTAAPLYLPFHETDNIGVAILLFPVTWVILFIYSVLAKNIKLVMALFTILTLCHAVMIYFALN